MSWFLFGFAIGWCMFSGGALVVMWWQQNYDCTDIYRRLRARIRGLKK